MSALVITFAAVACGTAAPVVERPSSPAAAAGAPVEAGPERFEFNASLSISDAHDGLRELIVEGGRSGSWMLVFPHDVDASVPGATRVLVTDGETQLPALLVEGQRPSFDLLVLGMSTGGAAPTEALQLNDEHRLETVDDTELIDDLQGDARSDRIALFAGAREDFTGEPSRLALESTTADVLQQIARASEVYRAFVWPMPQGRYELDPALPWSGSPRRLATLSSDVVHWLEVLVRPQGPAVRWAEPSVVREAAVVMGPGEVRSTEVGLPLLFHDLVERLESPSPPDATTRTLFVQPRGRLGRGHAVRTGDGYAVTWRQTGFRQPDRLMFVRTDRQLVPRAPATEVARSESLSYGTLASSGHGFVVVWVDQHAPWDRELLIRALSPEGAPTGQPLTVEREENASGAPFDLAWDSDGYAIAYRLGGDIYLRRFDTSAGTLTDRQHMGFLGAHFASGSSLRLLLHEGRAGAIVETPTSCFWVENDEEHRLPCARDEPGPRVAALGDRVGVAWARRNTRTRALEIWYVELGAPPPEATAD